MIIAYSYYVLSKNSNHTGFITRRKKNVGGKVGRPQNFSVSLISTVLDLNKAEISSQLELMLFFNQ